VAEVFDELGNAGLAEVIAWGGGVLALAVLALVNDAPDAATLAIPAGWLSATS